MNQIESDLASKFKTIHDQLLGRKSVMRSTAALWSLASYKILEGNHFPPLGAEALPITIVSAGVFVLGSFLDNLTTVYALRALDADSIQEGSFVESNPFLPSHPSEKQLLNGKGTIIDALALGLGTVFPPLGIGVGVSRISAAINNELIRRTIIRETEKRPLNTEEQPKEEVIRLDQEFPLFDPKRTSHIPAIEPFDLKSFIQGVWRPEVFSCPLTLRTELLPDLPLMVEGKRGWGKSDLLSRQSLTPFSPELGYELSEEDRELETRIQKLLKIKEGDKAWPGLLEELTGDLVSFLLRQKGKLPPQIINSKEACMRVKIMDNGVGEVLKKNGLAESISTGLGLTFVTDPATPQEQIAQEFDPFVIDAFKLKPETLESLRRLRLQLFFPNSQSLEAEPYEYNLQKYGTLCFDEFHPIGRPLPVASYERMGIDRKLKRLPEIQRRGLDLITPSNLNMLSQISARFVLADDNS